jgi:Flp pilus assembly protein CpaB
MFGSWRWRLARIGKWPRLCAVGLCLLLALSSALGGKHAAPSRRLETTPVVVAARDLPAGHTLSPRDLAVARWPTRIRPTSATTDPHALIGRRLAGRVAAREALTSSRIVGRDLTYGLAAGLAAVPVSVDDPHTADVVRAGDRIDLLATPRPDDVARAPSRAGSDPPVHTVTSRALVLAVLPGTDTADAALVLAVDAATAARIARDRSRQTFTVVLEPP